MRAIFKEKFQAQDFIQHSSLCKQWNTHTVIMNAYKLENIKLEPTEILEVSSFYLYLLIHTIKDVVRITEYSFKLIILDCLILSWCLILLCLYLCCILHNTTKTGTKYVGRTHGALLHSKPLSWVWWGRCEKKLSPEGGKKGGWRKKHTQRTRRARGSNPGPAAC